MEEFSVRKLILVWSEMILGRCVVMEVSGQTESYGCFWRRLIIAWTCVITSIGVSFLSLQMPPALSLTRAYGREVERAKLIEILKFFDFFLMSMSKGIFGL